MCENPPPFCQPLAMTNKDKAGNRASTGFGLIELMAALVVILGIIAAAAYYKNRPVDDPKKIDNTMPNWAETTGPGTGINYYLEGTVHRVRHNDEGVYFLLKTSSGQRYFIVGSKQVSAGIGNVAAGQVAALAVQTNTGPALRATAMVVSLTQQIDAFAYKYLVLTPAPVGFEDPEDQEEKDAKEE